MIASGLSSTSARSFSLNSFAQAQHDLRQLVHLLGIQAQAEAHLAALVGLQALHVVHVQRLDRVGVLLGGLLDLDAAFGGGDEGDRLARAVDQHRQVQLLGDVGGLGHQHAVDRQRHAGGLVGLHLRAEHALGVLAHLVVGLGELDAAGLAAAAGVDLGLDDPEVAADGLRRVDGLLRRAGDAPGRDRDAVIGKQLLRLIFVEVHGGLCAKRGSIVADAGPPGQSRLPLYSGQPHRGPPLAAHARPRQHARARCVASCISSPCIARWRPACWPWSFFSPFGDYFVEPRLPDARRHRRHRSTWSPRSCCSTPAGAARCTCRR